MAYQPSANVKVSIANQNNSSKLLKVIENWDKDVMQLLQNNPLGKNNQLYEDLETTVKFAKSSVLAYVQNSIKSNRPSLSTELKDAITRYYNDVLKGIKTTTSTLLDQKSLAYNISAVQNVENESQKIMAKYTPWSKNLISTIEKYKNESLKIIEKI